MRHLSFFHISLSSAALVFAGTQTVFQQPSVLLHDPSCIKDPLFLAFKQPLCFNLDDRAQGLSPPAPATDPPAPWTAEPACLKTYNESHVFCVYTSTTFNHGRGISIFTTPIIAEHIAQSQAFTDPDVFKTPVLAAIPPFTVQPLPGRGMGVIMNSTVHRGDSLFSYSPAVIIHREAFALFHEDDLHEFEKIAVDRLPERTREGFLALHGHAGGNKIDDIIHTNSFQVNFGPDEEKEAHNVVVPETSRMNHDCRPNAHYYFDLNHLTHYTHAIRTIYPGEELTISYIDNTRPREERLRLTFTSWGFPCMCSLCTQRDVFARESDRRLELMDELQTHLDDWSDESLATPEMAETVVALYQQERLDAAIALPYTYAALAYNAVGNAHMARKYASLALEAHLLNSGPDFSDVEATRTLMDYPESHWSWKRRV